jgi:uncharacterized protein YbgA (DUF1722 family)/uncharacterized protein YbbK (DUF523 family)
MPRRGEIQLGVSSCLLGNPVRFDGGHKHERYITDTLGVSFSFVPVCPEVEVGMPVPREPLRLVDPLDKPHMVGRETGKDWTARMNAWAGRHLRQLGKQDLSGFLLKGGSPSCGIEGVKVYDGAGIPCPKGRGLFAHALLERYPLLPVVEEGQLWDPQLRESFIVRVFAYHRVKALFAGGWKRREVVAFHAAEKYLLLAHSPERYGDLGRLVARIQDYTPAAFRDRYLRLYMEALSRASTVKKNVNVMQHIMGYFRRHLGDAERAEVRAAIEEYRRGLVPPVVPLTLLSHYARLHDINTLRNQVYLSPQRAQYMML